MALPWAMFSCADVNVYPDLLEGRVYSFFIYKQWYVAQRCFMNVNQVQKKGMCVCESLRGALSVCVRVRVGGKGYAWASAGV